MNILKSLFNKKAKMDDLSVNRSIDMNHFIVQGAGEIEISENAHVLCGTAAGFHFGVSWGSYGYAGGVLGRNEAKRLAEFILKKCEEITESEEEESKRHFDNINSYLKC